MKVGDKVERIHDTDWQNDHRRADAKKAKALGHSNFMGNASAYMHTDEAYVVIGISRTGGLRLRGFAALVSQKDVRLSNKEVFR